MHSNIVRLSVIMLLLLAGFIPVTFSGNSHTFFETSTADAQSILCTSAVRTFCTINDVGTECRNGGTCTDRDRTIINYLISTPNPISESDRAAARQLAEKNANATSISCSGLYAFFLNPTTCVARSLSVVIGTALITLTAWLLAVAGLLFNFLVDHTIVSFGKLVNENVKLAIETGWSGIRDIANIVIIGMFVFIAINIILGIKDFGDKKKIARVLIVAVLINFSLLFTKGIVDAGNFTAFQFYMAAGLTENAQSAQTTQGVLEKEFVQKGIAGQFIQLSGLPSAGKTYDALAAASFGSEETKFTTANGWLALLHGLVTATLFGITAFVLLYGCFILITRAIMIILLMLTSALAFASWLIPHQAIEMGWVTWWKALIKTAFLAPILMALLWATLLIARAASANPKGTLGELVTNPTATLNLEAIFIYVIVIGLLWASFYAANNLSHSISGFNMVSSGWMSALAVPLGLAFRGAGMVGRQTVGRYYARRSLKMDDEIEQSRAYAQATGNTRPLESFMRSKRRADWMANSSFNPMKADAAKKLGGALGVPAALLGGVGKDVSFGASAKATAERAAKEAAALALSPEDKEKMRRTAYETESTRLGGEREEKKRDRELRQKEIVRLESALKSQVDPLKAEQEALEAIKTSLERDHAEDETKQAKTAAAAGPGSDAERELAEMKAGHKLAIDAQASRIEEVKQKINTVKSDIIEHEVNVKNIDQDLREKYSDSAIHRTAGQHAREAVRENENAVRTVATDVGARLAYGTLVSKAQRAMGINPAKDTIAGKMAFKQAKKKMRVKTQVDVNRQIQEDARDAGEPIVDDEPREGGKS